MLAIAREGVEVIAEARIEDLETSSDVLAKARINSQDGITDWKTRSAIEVQRQALIWLAKARKGV